jgi:hypothetical protein
MIPVAEMVFGPERQPLRLTTMGGTSVLSPAKTRCWFWRHTEELKFAGKNDKAASRVFATGLSLVDGASNTGKSFALKSLDFMLDGGTQLPLITEREPYNTV